MSYCRFSDTSDVYVFHHVAGFFECCGCALPDVEFMFHTETASGMLEHLKAHQEADHLVPQYAIDRLKEEE